MTDAGVASSRPLRAIVVLLFLWASGRATYELAPLIGALPQTSPTVTRAAPAADRSAPATPQFVRDLASVSLPEPKPDARPQQVVARQRLSEPLPVAYQRADQPASAPTAQTSTDSLSPPADTKIAVALRSGTPRRLSLSSWLLVRDGSAGIAPAGTLGGSQVGVRAYLPITHDIAATARISSPLRTSGAEASGGIALRQGPVTLLLERRIALERGGRNDFSVTLAAGVDRVRLPRRFHLDAYGQAGFVGRDGFADGAVRIDRRIAAHGRTEVALGAGIWGGAQPGIARIDAGPQLVVRTPVAGGNLRASGEWRQRLVGNAQPASGPAITLGMDF